MSELNIPTRSLLSVSIRPKTDFDRDNLRKALNALAEQDPTLRVAAESAEGETIVSGMGELHLENACERISHEYNVEINVGKPRVIFLETIRRPGEAEGKFTRSNQYAHVKLRLEPLPAGGEYEFANELTGGTVPMQFIEPVNLGIQAAMKGGILAGHEVVDVRAVLFDGSYHEQYSNGIAFQIAASMAFKEAARKVSPTILEPVMSTKLVLPEEFMGAVIVDLNRRRGRIENIEHSGDSQVIHAVAPLAEMIGFAQHMRTITQGRATYSMHFLRYEEAPRRSDFGGDEAGVTADKPTPPKTGSGSAAADLAVE